MATNSHQFLELYHVAFLGSGVINPSNLRLADGELDHIVSDSGTGEAFETVGIAPVTPAGHCVDAG